MLGPWKRLDDRERERHRAARVGLGRDPTQVVGRSPEHLLVGCAGRGQVLQRDLHIDRQAGRAERVRFEPVAKAAVVVLVTAQGVHHTGRRRAAQTRREQAPLDKARLGHEEANACAERVIHGSEARQRQAAAS